MTRDKQLTSKLNWFIWKFLLFIGKVGNQLNDSGAFSLSLQNSNFFCVICYFLNMQLPSTVQYISHFQAIYCSALLLRLGVFFSTIDFIINQCINILLIIPVNEHSMDACYIEINIWYHHKISSCLNFYRNQTF